MKKISRFLIMLISAVLCLASCKSNNAENTLTGVHTHNGNEYYSIKYSGSISDYFTLVGKETNVNVSAPDGTDSFISVGVVKYRSASIGGKVVYCSSQTGVLLYLPEGFPETGIKTVCASFAMGNISDHMTVAEAAKYIPALDTDKTASSDAADVIMGIFECDHIYGEATCTEPKKCTKCGETEGSPIGHDHSAPTCTEPKICVRCGDETGEALGHNFSDATCKKPKTCKRCYITEGVALEHDYADADCIAPAKCVYCGQTSGDALGHRYADNVCINCGAVDPDSVPVGLDAVHVIDSSGYSYKQDSFGDSFGYTHTPYHLYGDYRDSYSIHYLNGEYSKFSGAIVASEKMGSSVEYAISVYVDGVLKYTKSNLKKTSGRVDFEVDVAGGQQLTIKIATNNAYYSNDHYTAVVEAELFK